MPKLPRWASFVLLPVAAACDGAAYYGIRGVLFVFLLEAGQDPESIGVMLAAAGIVSLIATAVAGGLAIAVGPWVGGALGAAAMALGALALCVMPPETAGLGVLLVSAGHGALRVSVLGAAARAFADFRTEQLRNVVFLGIYGATNLAAALSGAATELTAELAFLCATAFAMGAGAVLAGLGGAVLATREDAEPEEEAPKREGHSHLLVIGGVLLLSALPWITYQGGFGVLSELIREAPGGVSGHRWLFALNPMVVAGVCALLAGVAVVLHVTKVRVPNLVAIGVGFVFVSAGLVTLLGADSIEDGVVLPAVILMSVGEVLVGPLLLSRIAGDLPKRFPTLALAAFFLLSQGPLTLLNAASVLEGADRAIAWVGVLSAGVIGVAFAAAAFPLQRWLAPQTETPAEF